jgi:hypothetical protein
VDGGGTCLEMYGCEVSGCGGGDDLVPKDLGGIEVQVRHYKVSCKLLSGIEVQVRHYKVSCKLLSGIEVWL